MKKTTNKIVLGLFTAGAVATPVVAVVSCGVGGVDNSFNSWSKSHRDLITTTNTKNTAYTTAYSFDVARSNLSTLINGIYPSQGVLFSRVSDGT